MARTIGDFEDEARDFERGAVHAEKEAERTKKEYLYWSDRAKTMRYRANDAHIKLREARQRELVHMPKQKPRAKL